MKTRLVPKHLMLTAAIAALMTGCTGGTDTAQTTTPNTDTPVSVVAAGEIDGFGSVIVNGVHYETDSATFSLNGKSIREEDLDVGMTVEVEGTVKADGKSHAKQVYAFAKLAGPLDSVDPMTSSLTILGKKIVIGPETHLAGNIDPATLAPLAAGVVVQIHGQPQADGTIKATHVSIADDEDATEAKLTRLFGVIESLDTATMTLIIDGQKVDYSKANLQGAELAKGQKALVRGSLVDQTLVAEGVLMVLKTPVIKPKDTIEITGPIKRNPKGEWTLDGKPLTNVTAITLGQNPTDMVSGEVVLVTGKVGADGKIKVETIKRDSATTLSLVGTVEQLDATAKTLQIMGRTFSIQADTNFIDREEGERFFSFENLRLGDKLLVQGYKKDGVTIAKAITRLNTKPEANPAIERARLHTTIEKVEGNLLTTSEGILVEVTSETRLIPKLDITQLKLGADGDKVFIEGLYTAEGKVTARLITTLGATPPTLPVPNPDDKPVDPNRVEIIKNLQAMIKAVLDDSTLSWDEKQAKIAQYKMMIAELLTGKSTIDTPQDPKDPVTPKDPQEPKDPFPSDIKAQIDEINKAILAIKADDTLSEDEKSTQLAALKEKLVALLKRA